MNFKIQMLAGKDTKAFFERFYKNHRTLAASSSRAAFVNNSD